jgi:HAD superfamily hydrolase (TIGR01549 family)
MISTILFDFSRVLIFPYDRSYNGGLNELYVNSSQKEGFKFSKSFVLNEELLEYLAGVKDTFSLHIYTTGSIQYDKHCMEKIMPVFERIFTVNTVGLKKNEPASYKIISEMLEKKEEEILFIDDQMENIKAAQEAGLNTHHFRSTNETIEYLNSLNR